MDQNAMLYYHRIGTPQGGCSIASCYCVSSDTHSIRRVVAEDILVLKDETHPEWMWHMQVSEVDGRYLILSISRDTAPVRTSLRGTCLTP